jgi:hypothetical protein
LEPDPDHTGGGKRATAVIDTAAPLLPRGGFALPVSDRTSEHIDVSPN